MNVHHPRVTSRSTRFWILLLGLALVAALGLSWTSSVPSSADPSQPAPGEAAQRAGVTAGKHGHGRMYRNQWFGSWQFGSRLGFCIEFDRDHPNTSSVGHAPDQLPRYNKADSERVKFIVANFGATSNANDAAAAAIAVWKIQNTKRFNTYYAKMVKAKAIPKAIQHRAAAILAASRNHGPFRLTMTLGAGLPGMTVSGTVTARARNNTAVAGMAVSLTATNAGVVAGPARTNSAGVTGFRVKVAGPGAIKVTARMVTNSTRGIWITDPTPGHQRIAMAGGVRDTASAFRTSVRSYNGSRLANGCDGSCDGVAPIIASMKNECGSQLMRQTVLANGKVVGVMFAAACQTTKATFKVGDEGRVTTSYCYAARVNGPCTTASVAGPALTAECPPMATFRYEATCDCEAAKQFTFTVVGPKTPTRRSYTAVLTVSGQATQKLTLTGNGTQTFKTITAPIGTKVKLTASVLGKTFTLDEITVG